MSAYLLKNGTVVNEGQSKIQDIFIKNSRIEKIGTNLNITEAFTIFDCTNKIIMPGVIDDQVHFREPGLTHKATIGSEAASAVAGGTTSFMEMPNTNPPALTFELLENKYAIAQQTSVANYSFFMGVSNDNAEEALKINQNKNNYCGLKIFMGSSTGNMLVDNYLTLNKVFSNSEVLIATHCEREEIIKANLELAKNTYGENLNVHHHPIIRNVEACYESSYSAVQLAKQTGARLHILHISTAKELQLFGNMMPLNQKKITTEVCVHHLHFTADDYTMFGNQIKCNPAIKSPENKDALWTALLDDRLDIIATDHAPHTWQEKNELYVTAPSGVPLVQHALLLMLDYKSQDKISIEKIVEKMCHAPAICFNVKDRGYIREGYFADIVIVNPQEKYTVSKDNILHKCSWSPFEGHQFSHSIEKTFVNGNLVYVDGKINDAIKGERLIFDRD